MRLLLNAIGQVAARFGSRVDPVLLGLLLVLMGVGLAVLFSASGGREVVLRGQAVRFVIGLAALLAVAQIPPARLRTWTPWLYAGSLALLALVPVFGSGRSGQHWLNLGVFYLQPGELLKLTVPMMVAWLMHRNALPPSPKIVLAAMLLVGLPAGMIALQPDLGTAVPVAASGALVVVLAGLSWRWIAGLGGLGLVMAPLGWTLLKEYQKQRILTFLDPESDPLGSGWNIIQSKIAVGSGGLFGKGWTAGSQARLEYLPEQTTDFIFAVFAEEFGLVGVVAVLLLYLAILARCLWIAAESRDGFGRLLAGALALTFFLYVLLNGGMIAGLLPVVGVPMPLLSFGGTSALAFLIGFGLIMSVHSHRKILGH
jgi:rod shape determining protein RodA